MTLRVLPEGLTAASASVETLTAHLAAAHGGAAPLITAVAARGVQSGTSYAGDAAAAASYVGGGGGQ